MVANSPAFGLLSMKYVEGPAGPSNVSRRSVSAARVTLEDAVFFMLSPATGGRAACLSQHGNTPEGCRRIGWPTSRSASSAAGSAPDQAGIAATDRSRDPAVLRRDVRTRRRGAG